MQSILRSVQLKPLSSVAYVNGCNPASVTCLIRDYLALQWPSKAKSSQEVSQLKTNAFSSDKNNLFQFNNTHLLYKVFDSRIFGSSKDHLASR